MLSVVGRSFREWLSPSISYSQHGDDLALARALGEITSFIDIGANDGITYSNTYRFARRGAAGLCFEPVRSTWWKLRWFHRHHRKVRCIQEGLSDRSFRSEVEIYGPGGLMTAVCPLVPGAPRSRRCQSVQLRPFSYWANRYQEFQRVDFVSIDVEGHELKVLAGFDFDAFRSRCFVLETEKIPAAKIDRVLRPAGYVARLTNGRNTFWFSPDATTDAQLELVCRELPGFQRIGDVNAQAKIQPNRASGPAWPPA